MSVIVVKIFLVIWVIRTKINIALPRNKSPRNFEIWLSSVPITVV